MLKKSIRSATLFVFVLVAAACNHSDVPAPSPDIDVEELTVAEIKEAYENDRFTAEELTRAYLDRIERYESSYNAFTFLNPDALEQAREIDRKRRRGEALGPLAGIPVVIKESMDYAGLPSTAGWDRLSSQAGGVDLIPDKHAEAVRRLVAAGAIVIGKTNIPPFSNHDTHANESWAGPTYNAVDRAIAPGASSSGVATAVAGNFAVAGLAEETGGSIQNPSSAQSLVGVKPTFALVPNAGVVPLAGSTRDVVGPIARTVTDAALILDVIAGDDREDGDPDASDEHVPRGGYASELSATALNGKRLGLYGPGWRRLDGPGGALSAESRALYEAALEELAARGAILVEDPFAESAFAALADRNNPVAYDYRGTESVAHDFHDYIQGLGLGSFEEFRRVVGAVPFDEGQPLHWYVLEIPALEESLARPQDEPDLSSFFELRAQYLEVFNAVMDAHDLDALVFPQSSGTIPTREGDAFYSATTASEINIAGLPAVTVPAGQYDDNAPFGLIFVGREWSEALLLNLAYDYEQATQHRIVPTLSEARVRPD